VNDSEIEVRVCGVDGCRGGWVVASANGEFVTQDLAHLIPMFDVIGIDMPIGMSADGRRACDTEARKALPSRGSTVFPVPPRSLIDINDYARANQESKERFGRGVPRQAFAIWPRIRLLDVLAQRYPSRFVEVHPECSFARMAGRVLPTKHGEAGKNIRKKILEKHLGRACAALEGAKTDDVLDAQAVLWSALRFVRGVHETLGDGSVDECGLPMRIVV